MACYVFNGLCDGASEAEELPAASITRSLNVPVLMIYVCTHSEVLAVSVLVSVWFENIYRSEPVLPLLYSRRVSCYIVSHAPCWPMQAGCISSPDGNVHFYYRASP